MTQPTAQIIPLDTDAQAVEHYLAQHEKKSLLRFLTCGSVDDGKSTLLGRLLYDTKRLHQDQLQRLQDDSLRLGTQHNQLDFALLVDGLAAEREQGITIDVAYRYFGTEQRQFIVADCPGHEEYTRNMATGASNADLAVVLVDASKGLQTQTRRHSWICHLLGIRHLVLAVNKMDLVNYSQTVFEQIQSDYQTLAQQLGIKQVTAIPLSALKGDNLIQPSHHLAWFKGPSLLQLLETIEVDAADNHQTPWRFTVQWVCRPNASFRGYAGQVVQGEIQVNDPVTILPSGKTSRIARIVTADGDLPSATKGRAVTLVLADECDISRGDVLACADQPTQVARQFAAHLFWMETAPLQEHRAYWLRLGTQTVNVSVKNIRYKIDINNQAHINTKQLQLNEAGYCEFQLSESLAFERFQDSSALGSFILIDRLSNATVAAGVVDKVLDNSNVYWQSTHINAPARALIKGQKPACLWFTGLSGSGKSTLANKVEQLLYRKGYHTYLLDGDNLRHGLNSDLGFSQQDRIENLRRAGEVAHLMTEAGLIVLASFISPFAAVRNRIAARFDDGVFHEIFVDTPLETCEARDTKGLYARARQGDISQFTGISSPYERPTNPALHLTTDNHTADELAEQIVAYLLQN